MIHETIRLRGEHDESALLVSYVPDNFPEIDPQRVRRTVIVCPGGGYSHLARREAEPVALALMARGFNAFVLYYHIGEGCWPLPQQDLALAIAHVRANAERYHVKPGALAVMGFSAGGHLAGSLGVMWKRDEIFAPLGLTPQQVRPDAMVLCYPVITAGEHAHRGSFEHLSGSGEIADHQAYSLEKLVDDDTPPAFLWHTMTDASVPAENTLLMASALSEHKIRCEAHLYPAGRHGLGLASYETARKGDEDTQIVPECQGWIDLAARWLRDTL